MGVKLGKSAFPSSHGPDDFQCFGPPATKDDAFEGTMICDLGCFKQDDVDSNKYYHGAVVQSRKNSKFYAYFEWGRQGAGKPQFQMIECSSKEDAQTEYVDQLREKNIKRGVWINHATLGRMLEPKAGKDLYVVRPQATRATGLPDAKTITMNEGAKPVAKTVAPTVITKSPAVDSATLSLMRDLNGGTVQYTRSSMANAAIPTQAAIDEARLILTEAQKRVGTVGSDIDDQVNDNDLKRLTSLMYSRIPKIKARNADPSTWILSGNNIFSWQQDLDAFESALTVTDLGSAQQTDPFGGMRIKMRHLPRTDPLGEFIYGWWPKSTANKHGDVGTVRILNAWHIEREADVTRVLSTAKKIASQSPRITDRPLYQPIRKDLDTEESKLYLQSHTALLHHGSRTVNIMGLLRESWRLPKTLVGVAITAHMMGPGTYWADDIKKSIGYTSWSGSRYAHGAGAIASRGAFMFAADVILGSSYVAPSASGFTSPPNGHNSVMGKAGYTKGWNGPLLNNEFITYDVNQCRGRYLIEFSA